MNRDRRQLCLAAACAIAAHGAVLAVSARVRDRGDLAVIPTPTGRSPIVLAAPPVAEVKPTEPPPPDRLGELNGAGDAISAVDAREVATSDRPREFEQAWTRQQPMPLPSRSSDAREPAAEEQQTQKRNDAPSMGPMSVISGSALLAAKAPKPEAVSPVDPPAQLEPETLTDGETAKTVDAPAEPSVETEKPSLAASIADPDPAEQGESDLDAFAKEEGVAYTRGGMEAQGGREVKVKRPRVDLGFMADATRLPGQEFAVKLLVETDPTGHPTRVEVIGSSDSAIIDDAVRLAIYDSWFGGKMPDRFPFTVRFMRR